MGNGGSQWGGRREEGQGEGRRTDFSDTINLGNNEAEQKLSTVREHVLLPENGWSDYMTKECQSIILPLDVSHFLTLS